MFLLRIASYRPATTILVNILISVTWTCLFNLSDSHLASTTEEVKAKPKP